MNRLWFGLSRVMFVSAIVVAQLSAQTSDAPRSPSQTPTWTQRLKALPYRQIPVVHPELMAGGWKAIDASGAADDLFIRMATLSWGQEERLSRLSVSGSIRLDGGEPIEFSMPARLPSVLEDPTLSTVWNGKHLRLGANMEATGTVVIDRLRVVPIELDLTFDETRVEWAGTFGSRGLSKPVRFSRPRPSVRPPLITRLVGYWCREESGRASCVRIIEAADGEVRVWEDEVVWYRIPEDGVMMTQGEFGEERRVFQASPDEIEFARVLGTGVGGYVFRGRLSSDGARIEGQQRWPFTELAPPGIRRDPRPWTLTKSDTGAWPASSRRPIYNPKLP